VNADGSFSYTPNSGFTGTDSFSFAVTDGTLTSTPVTVTIYVGGSNHVPIANNDNFATDEDTDLVIFSNDVLANDVDIDGDLLTPEIVAQPAHGTITDNGDDSVTYSPNANFHGSDSFTYRIK